MLCPYDVASQQFLLDDDLADIFAAKHKDATLIFISDSCHSGTVSKFAPALPGTPAAEIRPRFLPPRAFLKDPKLLALLDETAVAGRSSRQKYPAILLAGCKDVQFSYDAVFNGRPNGAFTRVAIDTLTAAKPATPRAWMNEIKKQLPTASYPQTPQLYGSGAGKNGPLF
jgi:hypothetical protein